MSERTPSWGITPVPARLRTLGGARERDAVEQPRPQPARPRRRRAARPRALAARGAARDPRRRIFGNALLGGAAAIGAEAGVPAMVLLRAPLGRAGSYLPTGLNILQNLGWTVFEVLVIATAAHALVHGPLWLWKLAAAAAATILALVGRSASSASG